MLACMESNSITKSIICDCIFLIVRDYNHLIFLKVFHHWSLLYLQLRNTLGFEKKVHPIFPIVPNFFNDPSLNL